jgi:hypothetical protein
MFSLGGFSFDELVLSCSTKLSCPKPSLLNYVSEPRLMNNVQYRFVK